MKFFPYTYLVHGFNRAAFEQSLPELEHYRQQQMLQAPCGFIVPQTMLGTLQLHLGVPAPVALLIYLPESFREWLPTLVREVPSFCGLTAYYGLRQWTSFGWDLPVQARHTGFKYIRIDPEPLAFLYDTITGAYVGIEAGSSTAIGALPIIFVCGETLGVSALTIDVDWSDEFHACDFISANFKPRNHINLSEVDEQKARTKMGAIKAMEPELAELFLEDCRPKLTPVFDLRCMI